MPVHDLTKVLEVWTLQNLLNISIMIGILAAGLTMVQGYYQSLEKHLSLRVSIELWRVLTVLLVDVLLAFVVVVGYVVLNPDIMADIKIAIPFYPVATILFAIALVVRVFHHGHDPGSPNFLRAVYLMLAANIVNIVGFTFVAEAPSGEYLASHPSGFWDFIKCICGATPIQLAWSWHRLLSTCAFPSCWQWSSGQVGRPCIGSARRRRHNRCSGIGNWYWTIALAVASVLMSVRTVLSS